jgi:hypothetical protein
MTMINVIKRDGTRVPLDISKIQRQVAHACKGIDGVSPSMIEIKAQIELHDGMTTICYCKKECRIWYVYQGTARLVHRR